MINEVAIKEARIPIESIIINPDPGRNKINGNKTKRLSHKLLPIRGSRELAQADLDRYARLREMEVCG